MANDTKQTSAETPAEIIVETAPEPVESALTEQVEKIVETFDKRVDIPEWLEPLFGFLSDYPWLKGVIALLVFFLLAKVVEWIVSRVIRRLTARTSTHIDDLVVRYVRSPMFWSVALLGVLVAARVSGFGQGVQDVLTSMVLTVLIFLWMLFIMRLSKLLLSSASQHARTSSLIRSQTLPLFTNLAALAIFVFGIYFIFQVWHIDMTAWLASAGILGIAIGFAAKDTLANLFSGVFIMADSPYKIGDYVVLDDGNGLRGKVTHIGIRSTRLLTRDDVEVTIPNSIMGNSKVINESGGPHLKFRIRVAVGVAYGSDIDQVKAVLLKTRVDNLNLLQTGGDLLLVPQFTLAADTRSGMRPGFSTAAEPDTGAWLFGYMLGAAHQQYPSVAGGRAERQPHAQRGQRRQQRRLHRRLQLTVHQGAHQLFHLGARQVGDLARPIATAVLPSWAQGIAIEPRWHLVVLIVGEIGVGGDGPLTQLLEE